MIQSKLFESLLLSKSLPDTPLCPMGMFHNATTYLHINIFASFLILWSFRALCSLVYAISKGHEM